jgi:hypothetical protein
MADPGAERIASAWKIAKIQRLPEREFLEDRAMGVAARWRVGRQGEIGLSASPMIMTGPAAFSPSRSQ